MAKIFALIDCNNFYASCERAFNPALENKPLVILSSNDGCVIARSNEAKKLGIKMGEPYFKILPIVKDFNVRALSSNFTLYGDISRRIMSTLENYSPHCEVYSIDECFLDFSHLDNDQIIEQCQKIRSTLKKWLGIPVSIGVASTKTLAKLACEVAKHKPNGSFHISDEFLRIQTLKSSKVHDVWGIGRKYGIKLNLLGIFTAMDLVNTSDALIRKVTNVLGLKTVYELRGISCLDLAQVVEPKKSITVSRSFGKDVYNYEELKQAVAYFTSRAAEKLRKSGQIANSISIFIRTNPFTGNGKQYSNAVNITFPFPTDVTNEMLIAMEKALFSIYRSGYAYKKAGVFLCDFQPKTTKALNLFDKPEAREKSAKLMKALDQINNSYGKRTLFYASSGITQAWAPQSNMKSGAYTSNWNDIIKVY